MTAIYKEYVQQISAIYDESEAASIIHVLFEDLLGITRTERLMNGYREISDVHYEQIQQAVQRLMQHEPVQQIVGFAFFMDHKFSVNRHTLIPRPETEELIHLILNENSPRSNLRILDIGTGTGCIPISLALRLPAAKVSGWDISPEALQIAIQNAAQLHATVDFLQRNALTDLPDQQLDILVSNPPYIPEKESASMQSNVTLFEPGLALFVPDHDPLIFYRTIGLIGLKSLAAGGKLYFEIHERFGAEVASLLMEMGYKQVEIHQDLNGKDRMVRATSPR